MPVSEETYLRLALEEPNEWELHCGQLYRKPGMTAEHNNLGGELFFQLRQQLDRSRFQVRLFSGHVRRTAENYFIPDIFVVPTTLVNPLRERRDILEAYDAPLPLVVEIWSPSTGEYDFDVKLPEYQRRGDLEIWLLHPFDRSLRSWVRLPDGSYAESRHSGGMVTPVALSGVVIDLDALFDS
jgi:Uma2 family endonuclease